MGLKKTATLLVMMLVLFTALDTRADEQRTGIYNTPAVNLRIMPSLTSLSLGLANKGASCEILEETTVGDSLWYRVKISSVTINKKNLKGLTGWSCAEFIDLTEGPSTETSQTQPEDDISGQEDIDTTESLNMEDASAPSSEDSEGSVG